MTLGSTLVLGMGNPILSDDGVGLLVAGRLAEEALPPGVEVRAERGRGSSPARTCARIHPRYHY